MNPIAKGAVTLAVAIIAAISTLGFLASKLLPQGIAGPISTIFNVATAIVVVCALPFLAVLVWTMTRELVRRGNWGFMIILVGFIALVGGLAGEMIVNTVWPEQFATPVSTVAALLAVLVMVGGMILTLVGLLVLAATRQRRRA